MVEAQGGVPFRGGGRRPREAAQLGERTLRLVPPLRPPQAPLALSPVRAYPSAFPSSLSSLGPAPAPLPLACGHISEGCLFSPGNPLVGLGRLNM